jgi:hypothetical protein
MIGTAIVRAAVYVIAGREAISFIPPEEQFPVRRKHFPVLICREFARKILKLIRNLMSKIAKPVEKIANSLLFSLLSGNSGPKSGGIMARREHVPTVRHVAHLANRATISTWAE